MAIKKDEYERKRGLHSNKRITTNFLNSIVDLIMFWEGWLSRHAFWTLRQTEFEGGQKADSKKVGNFSLGLQEKVPKKPNLTWPSPTLALPGALIPFPNPAISPWLII